MIGYLSTRTDGRFEMKNRTGKYITYFTCGDPVELWDDIDGKWLSGRIEHNGTNYYLLLDNNTPIDIYNGDKVKIK